MYTIYNYPITVFYEEKDKDFIAFFVDMPYISAFGKTPNEAINELYEAGGMCLETMIEDKMPIPKPSNINAQNPLKMAA